MCTDTTPCGPLRSIHELEMGTLNQMQQSLQNLSSCPDAPSQTQQTSLKERVVELKLIKGRRTPSQHIPFASTNPILPRNQLTGTPIKTLWWVFGELPVELSESESKPTGKGFQTCSSTRTSFNFSPAASVQTLDLTHVCLCRLSAI